MEGNSRPQTPTEIIMDTQTEIKQLIRKSLFSAIRLMRFDEEVQKLIKKNVAEIEQQELREKAEQILYRFAKDQLKQSMNILKMENIMVFLAVMGASGKSIQANELKAIQWQINQKAQLLTKSEVNKCFTQLGNSQAKTGFGRTLYGYSETYARHQEQVDMVRELRKETKLVICDVHSDCSDRCFKWQGGIYSLDGSYGETEDGKKYISLEVAVNDTTYGQHNGLLGYNCRHKLHKYQKGMKAIKVSKEEQQREKKLSEIQRLLEREIRHEKEMVEAFKDAEQMKPFDSVLDKFCVDKAHEHRMKARELTAKYVKFCQDNNRVEYRSRIQV